MTNYTNEKVSFTQNFYQSIYTLVFLPILTLLFLFFCLFKTKARRTLFLHLQEAWNWKRITEKVISESLTKKLYWFHVSSVGEFLQALPIVSQLKNKAQESQTPVFVFMTYFSPSLQFFLKSKNQNHYHYQIDTLAVYPWDFSFFSSILFKKIKPSALLLTKFDLWPNLIFNSHNRGIPVYWISATLSPKSLRLKSSLARTFFATLVAQMSRIFCVSHGDKERILSLGSLIDKDKVEVCGDTRIDSVIEQKNNMGAKPNRASPTDVIQALHDFSSKHPKEPLLVCGSFWPKDLSTLAVGICRKKPFYFPLTVIAPHEVTEQSLKHFKNEMISWGFELQKESEKSQLFFNGELKSHILLVSQMGILAELYKFANLAFVGTGPGGVHNTLEPAVWGVPVVCGSKFKNAPEVSDLIHHQAAQTFTEPSDFLSFLSRIESDPAVLVEMGKKARDYVDSNKGSSEKCVIKIFQ